MLATVQVHAMLALAAATALIGGGRIEADAWREVREPGLRICPVSLTSLGMLGPTRPQLRGGR